MKILLFFWSLFLSSANPFFYGNWVLPKFGGVVFTFHQNHLLSVVEENGCIFRLTHEVEKKELEHDAFVIQFSNLKIVKPPSDWFNLKKYKAGLGLFHKIKHQNIQFDIKIMDNDTLKILPEWDPDSPFFLYRMK